MAAEPRTITQKATRAGSPNRSNRWAEKTIAEISGAVREVAYRESWAGRERGPFQRRNPRAKWVAALALLLATALLHHAVALGIVVAAVLGAAAATGLPPLVLLRRAAPFGAPALALILLMALTPAAGGWTGALRLALRLTASALIASTLVMTTRWTDLMRGLRGLYVPPLFVNVLEQTRHHLVQLPLTAEEMFQARRARTVGIASAGSARRFVGYSMGTLLGKTQANAEASHAAMLARGYGYHGATGSAPGTRWTKGDVVLIAVVLSAAVVLVGVDHHFG